MRPLPLLLGALLFVASGCVQSIAVSTVGGIVDQGFSAFTEDDDLVFVESALPANLKLIEVMLKSQPDNERLLLLASEGYSSYALGFLEDSDLTRARVFYMRGKEYALRVLKQHAEVSQALTGSVDELKAAVSHLDEDDVPAVFWAAFGWGSYVYLSLTEPDAIADLPRTEALMTFVAERDPAFYYGGAHLFLGTLYGSRPKMLGGNTELAQRHFEKAHQINEGKFLMGYVYQARSVAVQTQDEAMFDDLLAKVDSTSLEVLPEFRLANAIAKKKAQLLHARKNELF